MADTKISDLTAASALTGSEEIPISDGTATTKAATADQVKTFVNTAPSFGAGSASANSWPKLASGTLLTTPEAGAIERDAEAFYMTTDAGNRGVVGVKHFIRQAASRSLPNNTNENAIFDSVANGRLTLEAGTYFFGGMIYVTGMSATNGNASIDILGAGSATCADWLWQAWGVDNTTLTNAGTRTGSFSITQQSAASVATAGTGTGLAVQIEGTVEVTSAGTMIPSIDLVTASAATLAAGSYFWFERIGAPNVVSVGQWD